MGAAGLSGTPISHLNIGIIILVLPVMGSPEDHRVLEILGKCSFVQIPNVVTINSINSGGKAGCALGALATCRTCRRKALKSRVLRALHRDASSSLVRLASLTPFLLELFSFSLLPMPKFVQTKSFA